jgi:predicted transcriptional regulator
MSNLFACKRIVSISIIRRVARKTFLGIRISPELKKALERIAESEERSLSQICELILRHGVEEHKKDSTRYLRRFLGQGKMGPTE